MDEALTSDYSRVIAEFPFDFLMSVAKVTVGGSVMVGTLQEDFYKLRFHFFTRLLGESIS